MEGAQALAPTLGVVAACAALGVPRSSFYFAQRPIQPAATPPQRPRSHRALSDEERAHIRELLNSERFVDQAPRSIYASLLDDLVYHCSWRTMYRGVGNDSLILPP